MFSSRSRPLSVLALAAFCLIATLAVLFPPLSVSANPPTITGDAATGGGLLVSASPDRSTPLRLDGATVSGDEIHVFWARTADPVDGRDVRYVDFVLDGTTVQREWIAPFDLAGTDADGGAQALVVSDLTPGSHTIEARVKHRKGPVAKEVANFTVADPAAQDPPDRLMLSRSADRSSAVDVDGAVVTADDVYVFWAQDGDPSDGSGIQHVDFSVDGSHIRRESIVAYDLGATDGSVAKPFSVRHLADGAHDVSATIRFTDGSTRTDSATFEIPAESTTTTTKPTTTTTTTKPTTTTAPPTTTAPAPTTTTTAPPADQGKALRWAPPKLSNPTTINVSTQPSTIWLDDTRDYIIKMPSSPVTKAMGIRGGRNVVLIGGEIAIPWQGSSASSSSRRALILMDQVGTVHIEGLLMRGQDISEGIQIDAPLARVQLQNIRAENLHARDQVNFTDNHPDVIQPYGGVRELLIDKLTGESDYQGLFLPEDKGPIGRVELHRVNILGSQTARYLLWASTGYPLTVDEVYAKPAPGRSWDMTVWKTAYWGNAKQGVPAAGDFVKAGDAGIGYVSPGYMG